MPKNNYLNYLLISVKEQYLINPDFGIVALWNLGKSPIFFTFLSWDECWWMQLIEK